MELATLTWSLGAVVALLCASAFFSCTEIAVFSLPGDWRPDADARPGATTDERALAALRSDPHRLLVTLLVGNNLMNIAISSLVTVVLVGLLPEGLAVVAATLAASSVVLVFGEILPKAYGLAHAERWRSPRRGRSRSSDTPSTRSSRSSIWSLAD